MITIDALRICDGERTPLDGVTMLLTANAVHGIAGEGRSELLRAVYGLAVPESGSVTSGGHPLRRRDMAYLEAEPRFWPGLTAGDCLGIGPGSVASAAARTARRRSSRLAAQRAETAGADPAADAA